MIYIAEAYKIFVLKKTIEVLFLEIKIERSMDQYGHSLQEVKNNPKYKDHYPKIKNPAGAVVKIQMDWHPLCDQVCTGFMVSNNSPLLLTALHIIPDQKTLTHSSAWFHYNENSSSEEIVPFREIIYSNARLDFALKLKVCHFYEFFR